MTFFLLTGLTLFLNAASTIAAQPELVLLDTDSAYFNDDGAALAMLLQSPERVRLLGITVVAGNLWPKQGVEYLLPLLELFHAERTPLYLGAEHPLVNDARRVAKMEREWGGMEWKAAFSRPPPRSRRDLEPPFGGKFATLRPRSGNAVDFIIDSVERNPHQITLLAIGPMTNIALALRKRPDIQDKIRRLVFMGGNAQVPGNTTAHAETNFWFDPEAAQIVLRSRIPEKVMFGLDITNRAVLDKALFDRVARANTPITRIYDHDLGDGGPAFHHHPEAKFYVWDCLAAAYLIDSGFVTRSETMYVDVITQFGPAYGGVTAYSTRLAPGRATPKVTVMLNLDPRKFDSLYVHLLTQPLPPPSRVRR